jgi:hypothetical protein
MIEVYQIKPEIAAGYQYSFLRNNKTKDGMSGTTTSIRTSFILRIYK